MKTERETQKSDQAIWRINRIAGYINPEGINYARFKRITAGIEKSMSIVPFSAPDDEYASAYAAYEAAHKLAKTALVKHESKLTPVDLLKDHGWRNVSGRFKQKETAKGYEVVFTSSGRLGDYSMNLVQSSVRPYYATDRKPVVRYGPYTYPRMKIGPAWTRITFHFVKMG